VSTILKTTTLSLAQGESSVKFAEGPDIKPKHGAAYWASVTKSFDFSDADLVPAARYNRVLWTGLMGRKPYPAILGRHEVENERDDD
jgi:hypothetical protein